MPSDKEPPSCFVAMPFGRDTDEQRWFMGWYKEVIEIAVTEAGYRSVLAAQVNRPTAINDEIRQHLISDPMVVVDLGGRQPKDEPNPNVMYELGIRHAFDKPLVIMAWQGQQLPFDIQNQRAIVSRRDPLEFADIRAKLTDFLAAAAKGDFYRPMQQLANAAVLDATQAATKDETMYAVLNELKSVRDQIRLLESRLADLEIRSLVM